MNFPKSITNIYRVFKKLSSDQKSNLVLFSGLIFLLLFSYPLVRSSTTSFFLTHFAASKSPYVWLYSVIGLSLCVSFYNSLLKKTSIVKLYKLTCVVTLVLFLVSFGIYELALPSFAYVLYVLKEIYIILLIHSIFAYVNTTIEEGTAKVFYGPLGAIGSIGGILGGLLVSFLGKSFHGGVIFTIGVLVAVSSGFVIGFIKESKSLHFQEFKKEKSKVAPLDSIKDILPYVGLICVVVLASQFVLGLANYEFNFFVQENYPSAAAKTSYLGSVYSSINALSLVVQFALMPTLFRTVPPPIIHLIIPVLYSGFFVFAGVAPMAAGAFIFMKGIDYSIFAGAKELLYFPLKDLQKYGAKYLTDMVVYRMSKGIISVILILVPTSGMVKVFFWLTIGLWLAALWPLGKYYQRYHNDHGDHNEQPPYSKI